jgi:light-regulated signal transduction histidine kinase (bacteriophytochrome)
MEKMKDLQRSASSFGAIPDAVLGLAIIALTFLTFYLDIITGEKFTFYVFYFPSIMIIAWRFGWRSGFLTVILSILLWTTAQWDTTLRTDTTIFIWNVSIRFLTFLIVCGMVSMIRKRKELLEAKSKELARSNAELEQFAFRAAHDLKAPITNLLGFAQFLDEKYQGNQEQETKECMQGILNSAWRMNAMVKALLDYATVTRKEKDVPVVEVTKVVEETIKNLSVMIAEKKAHVTFDPLPALAINPALGDLIFQNLIMNAIKYCEKEPRIHISAVRQGTEWLFSVRDNGIGIPKESLERIFIMFEKLVTRQKYPGSGIGLATCQKIVEHYGGCIWVESPPKDGSVQGRVAEDPGKGSTFFFTLPAG